MICEQLLYIIILINGIFLSRSKVKPLSTKPEKHQSLTSLVDVWALLIKAIFSIKPSPTFSKSSWWINLEPEWMFLGFFNQIKIFSQYEFMINFWTFTGHASFSLFSGFHLITFLTVVKTPMFHEVRMSSIWIQKCLSYWLCLFHKVKQLNEHPLSVVIPYFSCISLVLSIARNRMEPANTYEWQVICIPIRVSSIWLICHKGPYDGGYLWAGFPVSAEDSWSPFRVTASSCSPPETKHTLHSHLSWSEVCFV